MFGGAPTRIVCQVNRITDIELEPGERVEDFSISDGSKWSISASWNESEGGLVTHVLLQTFFPGISSDLKIFTDRRVYEMELVSGLDAAHMAHIGFTYPGAPVEKAEEEIPQGRYRDLLVDYGIIEGAKTEETLKDPVLVDGAELNFRCT